MGNFRRITLAAAVTAVLSAVLTVPAFAGPPTPHCGSNIVCWYSGSNFSGKIGSNNPVSSGDCYDLSKISTVAESVANASDFRQRFWSNRDCTGVSVLVEPGQEKPSIGFQANSQGGE
jgi:hypothetical protein